MEEFLVAEEPQVCWLDAEVSKSAAEEVEGSAGESVAALRTAEVGLGPELALSAEQAVGVVGTRTAEVLSAAEGGTAEVDGEVLEVGTVGVALVTEAVFG